MKKLSILLLLPLLFLLISCSKDTILTKKVDNKWVATVFTVDGDDWLPASLNIDKDGTFIFDNDGDIYTGTWKVSNEELILTYTGSDGTVSSDPLEAYTIVELTKNNIYLEGTIDGDIVVFKGTKQ